MNKATIGLISILTLVGLKVFAADTGVYLCQEQTMVEKAKGVSFKNKSKDDGAKQFLVDASGKVLSAHEAMQTLATKK